MAIPIGVQLYSVRTDAAQDLSGVLEKIAKMGYTGVEFAGYYGHTASDIRKMLDDNGLVCCGSHTAINTLLPDELFDTIKFNQTLGNKFLIVPGLPSQYTDSKAAWLQTAHTMNEISDKLTPLGLYTGYHNHHTEFLDMDGELPWDIFFGNTRKEVVMQFDTGNARHGGASAEAFLAKYPGRALTVHLKEFSETVDDALIGDGDVDFPEIFRLCESVGGTQWYIVEYERPTKPALEAIDSCLKNLRAMGK
ncbi:MAG: sugar phosphate isomerase/epimerase [Chthonomonadaceae bacterium]|nr:sugar phosphate isomerase/epimerase [Chthonomonadaceae bacterium]